MKAIVHVNQHHIKANRADGGHRPVLTNKTSTGNLYSHTTIIHDGQGNEIGRFRYEPNSPLSCGAHVWFETSSEYVTVIDGVTPAEAKNNIVPFATYLNKPVA